jgi:uncharacterized RDD family membrane protein YckC
MTDLHLPEKRLFLGPAMLWKRIVAFMLDLFMIDFFILSPFSAVAEKIFTGTTDVLAAYRMIQDNSSQLQALTMMFSVIITLALAYFVLMQYAVGQTPGCMLLNLHVVSEVDGKVFARPTFWQCFVRNIFIIPAIPFVLLWIIDPFYLFFAKKNQRLSEWLSNTRVIEQYVM